MSRKSPKTRQRELETSTRTQVEELREEIRRLLADKRQKQQEIKNLGDKITEKQREHRTLQTKKEDLDEVVLALQEEVAHSQSIQHLEDTQSEHLRCIAKLKKDIAELERQRGENDREIQRLNNDILSRERDEGLLRDQNKQQREDILSLNTESERLRLDLAKLRRENEEQRLMINDQVPMIACSVGSGMVVSALGMLLIWLFCRNKRKQRKDPECTDSKSNHQIVQETNGDHVIDLVVEPSVSIKTIDSDNDCVRDHDQIMIIGDGQHMTAGWSGNEVNQQGSGMDWSEEHDEDEEKAEYEMDTPQ